jgi:hypothetical protein
VRIGGAAASLSIPQSESEMKPPTIAP